MPRGQEQIVVERGASCAALTTGTYFCLGSNNGVPVVATGNAGAGAFYIEPDDVIGQKLRFRVSSLVNAVAPVASYTVGLYAITAVAGGAGIVTITPGTVLAGTATAVTLPGANSITLAVGSEFDPPTAGWYAVGIVASANGTANTCVQLTIQLEAR